MTPNLADLNAFVTVAHARGFGEASRTAGASASTLSEAVRRLEGSLGVRLLHRTTRSVAPTEAGTRLLERLAPAPGEVEAALGAVDDLRDGVTGNDDPEQQAPAVPSSAREWCPMHHPIGHSQHWTISIDDRSASICANCEWTG